MPPLALHALLFFCNTLMLAIFTLCVKYRLQNVGNALKCNRHNTMLNYAKYKHNKAKH